MKLRTVSLLVSGWVASALAACSSSDSTSTAGSGGAGNVGNGGTGNQAGTAGTGTGGSSTGGSSATGGGGGSCKDGEKQCSGSAPQTCVGGKWQTGASCPFVCSAGDCTGSCVPGSGQCNGLTPQTCDANGNWQDGADCPFLCKQGVCSGECVPGSTSCKLKFPLTCDNDGKWQVGTECSFACEAGKCKDVCVAGEFHCKGNTVQVCDPTPPAKWVDKSPATVCNASSGQKCDYKDGTCKTVTPLGTASPTGTYYQYAVFKTSTSAFKGGYDVDGYDDLLYVNRGGTDIDVYKVTLLDTDGDGKLEPDQHPQNPLAKGPVEQRTLTFIKTISRTLDGAPVGPSSTAELYVLADRLFSLGTKSGTKTGGVTEYLFSNKSTNLVVSATNVVPSQMGFGDADGVWYASNESARRVYSYDKESNQWVVEFGYPDLAGSHMDGMEVIVSPATGEQYVYVSDMTSDFLGQYIRDPKGSFPYWKQVNIFQYSDATGSTVEGMGFGPLNHFWACGGTYLYEIGGGDLQQYVE